MAPTSHPLSLRSPYAHSLLALAGIAAIGLGATACGPAAADTGAAPPAAAPAAATTTKTATTSTATTNATKADLDALGAKVSAALARQGSGRITGTFAGRTVRADIAATAKGLRATVRSGSDQLVVINRELWMKKGTSAWKHRILPKNRAALHGSTPENGLKALKDTDKLSPKQLRQMTKSTKGLSGLADYLGTSVRDLGRSAVAGTSLHHYRSTVSLAKVSSVLPRQATAHLGQLKAFGITSATADLWTDSRNLPVRVTVDLNGAPAGMGAADLHFGHWGETVSVKAPTKP